MNYVNGDLFKVDSGIIVHGCNMQRVMGAGCALIVKTRYPEAYRQYVADIKMGMQLGGVSWCEINSKLVIASALTQEYFGSDQKKYISYDAIDKSFLEIFESALEYNRKVSIPKIGAGLGGGDWIVIENIINSAARNVGYESNNITLFEI